ncbi:alpha/beta hydrolase [Actinoalloteichus sp. AHMU CJ021]|uniref:Pimeloyl-ACP methyl ester carboxylesterase n=1 Tax=Actinoalloteichus caeruleus DSM 43889 TaxID=1120930 RepID=A0ABT1JEF7_ACTCY|nr:alpha/beta hydrolase [Actinoalloteichus caeruleus]AUS81277.1 alpha/beta hydrolase [Actinoalloteichus sp. AHMU CJ021]MCP2330798.1 Pimeloyl-ACP methyl ester carboxylesterase [Actinoalloteichus caeruleus DSM 43889]
MEHQPRTGFLRVPGARLYHEVRGSGTPLLIIPTGNGDAAPFAPLADRLARRHTVITYDRRGFSRSTLEGPVQDDRRIGEDVEDIRALLDHLSSGPAHVFGSSSGAIIALALVERYPEGLRTAVSHEPPLASVMADSRRWLGFYRDLHATYQRSGVEEARRMFRTAMGMTTSTRAPAHTEQSPERLAEMLDRLRRNQLFWFEHEVIPYPAHRPDLDVLRSVSDRLVLAGGADSREHFPYRPNLVLAERLGLDITHFSGGHVGYVTHPDEFAAELGGLLRAREH